MSTVRPPFSAPIATIIWLTAFKARLPSKILTVPLRRTEKERPAPYSSTTAPTVPDGPQKAMTKTKSKTFHGSCRFEDTPPHLHMERPHREYCERMPTSTNQTLLRLERSL